LPLPKVHAISQETDTGYAQDLYGSYGACLFAVGGAVVLYIVIAATVVITLNP